MKVNYVLMYGTPYLKYREFETFDDISKYLINKRICNYTIFEKVADDKEVEMIMLNNDIEVLEQRIDKAIKYIENKKETYWEHRKGWVTRYSKNSKDLLKILKGEGIVQICHCSNCGAEIEYRIPINQEEKVD